MEHSHKKIICSGCNAIITQCRCLDPEKPIEYRRCNQCGPEPAVPGERLRLMFVSGKYRADTIHGIQQNIWVARTWAIRIWQSGAVAICPHLNTANFDGSCPDEVWLAGCIEILRRCDAIFMLPNYQDSQGALMELGAARALGLAIFYPSDWNEYLDWLKRDLQHEKNMQQAEAAGAIMRRLTGETATE